MVLDQNLNLAELVQFAGIDFGGFIAEVSLRKKQFGRPFDARANLADLVDLALPASAQQGKDLIFAGYFTPRHEVERIDHCFQSAISCQDNSP